MVQMSLQIRAGAEDLKAIPIESNVEPVSMDKLFTEREREQSHPS